MRYNVKGLFKSSFWNKSLILLTISVFFNGFGAGIVAGTSTNFYVQVLNLTGSQVLWLQGLREIPGLLLILIAAVISHLPLTWRAFGSVIVMGIGYALFAVVNSFGGLVAMAIAASIGFHVWLPLQSTLGMHLCSKEDSGKVMGVLTAAGALASFAGIGGVAVFAAMLPLQSLRWFFIVAGFLIIIAGMLLLRLPKALGHTTTPQPRLFFRRRYWLYYVLTFFEGSRIQLFAAFGTLVLVQNYSFSTQQISLLLLASGLVNFFAAPIFGRLLDRVGERRVLAISYTVLALCFVGYATIHAGIWLSVILILINLLTMLSMGLSTYVNRIAPAGELAPTLNSGVSVNHVTSVGMAFVAGALLRQVGYEALCWGVVVVIMASVPFALAIKNRLLPVFPAQATSE
jgi:predicted MFS family arabinose efflux permease